MKQRIRETKVIMGMPVTIEIVDFADAKEAIDSVDKNGYFELNLKIDNTRTVILKIDNLAGKLYIQPDFVYGITFPSRDTVKVKTTESEELVNLGVISADTIERSEEHTSELQSQR